MEIAANSEAALVSLLLNFAYVDGELHPKEVDVIERACADLDVAPELVTNISSARNPRQGEFISSCVQAMSKITDENLRNKAMLALHDIAAADDVLDENERTFLSLASERWGVKVVEPEEFSWDEHQRLVVEAAGNERLEVYAGPGMGKTAVACARVSKLIAAGVEPSNIWLLSFTRTAVQEIRDRIESFADNSHSVLGVKIGTVDSRAWRIRYGFSEGDVKKLFGSYDASIRDVLDMIETDPREIREFLDSLEHLIIDEAQDITGPRARLVAAMIKLLPDHCGVTVFADPAQAIYGWTTDGEDVPQEDRVNLLGMLNDDAGFSFTQHELQTIHRTEVPNLVELMEELRLDIYVNERIDVDAFRKRRRIIASKANERLAAFDAEDLNKYQDALVLFRRRSEVLMASSFANSEGIRHRVRMSGLPTMVLPWLGCLFSDYTDSTIDRAGFAKRWDAQDHSLGIFDSDHGAAWDLVYGLGGKRGLVRVDDVRKRLARTPPEITATVPDLGTSGSIIGTIHASKGREADQVILRLPHERHRSQIEELDEESRVMFVGASRARNRLYVGSGFFRAIFAPSLPSGRSYLKTKHVPVGESLFPAAQVEIGRQGDIDPYSFVSKTHHGRDRACEIQRRLAELASETPLPLHARCDRSNDYRYQIWTEFNGTDAAQPIGYFAAALNGEFFKLCPPGYRPPNSVEHIYLVGVSTFAAGEDDERLREIHQPYAATGIWLVPIILGYPPVAFPKKWRRSRYS